MSFSYTSSESTSFTITHARHMATKVAADLKRMQRFYGLPTDATIDQYEQELTAFLKAGYLDTVSYGFRRGEQFIEPTLRYTAHDLAGANTADDDPGGIRPRVNVEGAVFHSYLTYSQSWINLSYRDREAFEKTLPFQRSSAPEPGIGGYLEADRTYSSGGRAINRGSIRSF